MIKRIFFFLLISHLILSCSNKNDNFDVIYGHWKVSKVVTENNVYENIEIINHNNDDTYIEMHHGYSLFFDQQDFLIDLTSDAQLGFQINCDNKLTTIDDKLNLNLFNCNDDDYEGDLNINVIDDDISKQKIIIFNENIEFHCERIKIKQLPF